MKKAKQAAKGNPLVTGGSSWMDHSWQYIDFDNEYAIAASYISEKDSIVSAVIREKRPCLNV